MQGNMKVPVLKDVNFRIQDGEYVAIMGPSGSGKSTLMNLIGCLDTITDGTLILDNQNISNCTENELSDIRLKKIGFIFQNFQLLSYLTALDNVALPLVYAGIKKKERTRLAEEALAKVNLTDRATFLPNQLSGGQKQRVAIARAIINNPKIVLADEPTGALDSQSGKQVMQIFQELNKAGVAVLVITHDPNVASYASRIVKIQDGILTE